MGHTCDSVTVSPTQREPRVAFRYCRSDELTPDTSFGRCRSCPTCDPVEQVRVLPRQSQCDSRVQASRVLVVFDDQLLRRCLVAVLGLELGEKFTDAVVVLPGKNAPCERVVNRSEQPGGLSGFCYLLASCFSKSSLHLFGFSQWLWPL